MNTILTPTPSNTNTTNTDFSETTFNKAFLERSLDIKFYNYQNNTILADLLKNPIFVFKHIYDSLLFTLEEGDPIEDCKTILNTIFYQLPQVILAITNRHTIVGEMIYNRIFEGTKFYFPKEWLNEKEPYSKENLLLISFILTELFFDQHRGVYTTILKNRTYKRNTRLTYRQYISNVISFLINFRCAMPNYKPGLIVEEKKEIRQIWSELYDINQNISRDKRKIKLEN